jgi:putative effector of murein hydrolase LrgA (UPF0299 family)
VKIPTPGGVDLVDHIDYLLAAVPSMAALILFNDINKAFMQKLFKIKQFPPPLVGMFIFFGTMLSLEDSKAARFVDFFEPAVTLLTNFLPVFFMPGLLNAPQAMSKIALSDFLKFVVVIALGMTAITVKAGLLGEYVMGISKAGAPPPAAHSAAKFSPWFSAEAELIAGALTAATGLLAVVKPSVQQSFYASATFFAFIASARLPRLLPANVNKLLHPLIITYLSGTLLFMAQGALRGVGLFAMLRYAK